MINKKVTIIDYGLGNLLSLKRAFEFLNTNVVITNEHKVISNSSRVILPGVGAFEAGINKLKKMKWDNKIHEFVENGGYLFGICLGMQLLFKYGTNEKTNQEIKGLGFFDGKCEKVRYLIYFITF